jgi:hypothetical protein
MLAIAERRARPKAERFYRPLRDASCLFALFPSTSYWATFTESLPFALCAMADRPGQVLSVDS